jgi:hypothetical protein
MSDSPLETYSFRLPADTKRMTEALSPPMKKKLTHELQITVARVLHEAAFDPSVYLGGESKREG